MAGIVVHRIGYCSNCGWVHRAVSRVRQIEEDSRGKYAVIKALCEDYQKGIRREVLCDLCGRKHGDNLYPVTLAKAQYGKKQFCAVFVHLCPECRMLPHKEVLNRLKPPNLCEDCKGKFVCFTNIGTSPPPTMKTPARIEGKSMTVHKSPFWVINKLARRRYKR